MTTFNFAGLLAQAEKEGLSVDPLPDGNGYELEIANVNHRTTQNQKLQFGIQWKVLSGPSQGKTAWENQTLTTDNPKALAVFFRKMAAIGAGPDFFATEPSPDEVCNRIRGFRGVVDVGHREWGNPPKVDNTFNVRSALTATAAAPASPPPPATPAAAPAFQPPPAPAPAPAPAPQAPFVPPAPPAVPAQDPANI